MAVARDVTRPTLPAEEIPAPAARAERRPLRDNPRLILLGILLLIGALVAMVYLADQSTQFSPDFLTEVLLYALSAADITMLLALVFVLARNIVKLVVERRRGLPFSRFRAKLVLAMLGLTIIPSVLVLIVGGELIRQTTARWFADPIEEVLRSANAIAVDYYTEHQAVVAGHADRIARGLPAAALQGGDVASIRAAIEPDVRRGRVGLVEVYRVRANGPPSPVVAVESPSLPRGHARASADLLAARSPRAAGIRPHTIRWTAAASLSGPAFSSAIPRPGRRSASSLPAIILPAPWPSTPDGSPMPTRDTAGCSC